MGIFAVQYGEKAKIKVATQGGIVLNFEGKSIIHI